MRKLFSIVLVFVLFTSVSFAATKAPELYFPPATGQWETITPEKAGINPQKLQMVVEYAKKQNSTGLIILYKGRILLEQNWKLSGKQGSFYKMALVKTTTDGRAIEDVASAQKSIISFIAAIAREQGKLDIDRPVSCYIGTGWSHASLSQENKITVRHLLSMSSGLSKTLDYQEPAGSIWGYNSKAYSKLIPIIEAATGKHLPELTSDWLLKPTDMNQSRWISRSWVKDSTDANKLGFASSARDLAKFGLLILARGTWNGRAVVKNPQFLIEALEPSQNLNPNYGFLWWLNANNKYPAIPRDMVQALGFLDRIVMVIPSKHFVFVRIGDKGERTFRANLLKLLSAVLPD